MNLEAAGLREQLHAPDRAGRDLALLRTRVYRFSNDLRWYVLRVDRRAVPGREAAEAVHHGHGPRLLGQNPGGWLPAALPGLGRLRESLTSKPVWATARRSRWQCFTGGVRPARIVVIVGAPRSGTSHLFNLLAATDRFSYFTTASCWAGQCATSASLGGECSPPSARARSSWSTEDPHHPQPCNARRGRRHLAPRHARLPTSSGPPLRHQPPARGREPRHSRSRRERAPGLLRP